ncbi:MAG TPA: peptidase M14 [Bacillales bacterium]|nr:peptidase M14 [Bacillales bacterium]
MKIKGRAEHSLWYYSQLFKVPLSLISDSNIHLHVNDTLDDKVINIPGYFVKEYDLAQNDSFDSLATKLNINTEALHLVNHGDLTNLTEYSKINIPVRVTEPIVNGEQKYTYLTMSEDIKRLEEIYPFMKTNTIGHSVQNREILEVIVGNGPKQVHMNGSFHANEWITTAVLMAFLNNYLLSITNQTSLAGLKTEPLYHNATLSLVPMVNPDGVELVLNGLANDDKSLEYVIALNEGSPDFSNWKANMNGVDLNKQFPAKWELEQPRKPQQPGPRDFPGYRPLSEPETMAMATLTMNSNFDRVIAFHTQCKEIYWGFDDREPPYSKIIVNEFVKNSGYRPVQTLDSYSGFKDWFIYEWKKPGFTVELGEGENPLPITQFKNIYDESIGIFLAGLYM